eukprot:TRINITY_DN6788_c0_g2_i1.p1 TRINITY_DN6788_c0_g2~~TRINITY_DN6788_c0_g2_i1.p1  ORF type:complete len:119 (-),score=22.56 TRINITY_DN6788_c0_g2_i1:100-414(-)
MYAITVSEPPKLKEPNKWSPEFCDFVEKCLKKIPDQRPSTAVLLAHKYFDGLKLDLARHTLKKFFEPRILTEADLSVYQPPKNRERSSSPLCGREKSVTYSLTR